MGLNPIFASGELKKKYVRYLTTTFKINNQNLQNQFEHKMLEEGKISKGPYLSVINSFEKGKGIKGLIDEGVLTKEFYDFKSEAFPFKDMNQNLYLHQEKAIRKIINKKNIIVSTGTGSGKTESFLIPIFNQLLLEKRGKTLDSGVRALLLYPMNALANDQIKRLRKILSHYPDITFGCYTGETEEYPDKAREKYISLNKNNPLPNEILSRKEMRENPPHILITNYAMLEYLMIRPGDKEFFNVKNAKKWKFVVIDEAHTYSGATGIEVSMLMRRLKTFLNRKGEIQYILTSASLGRGKEDYREIAKFGEKLCGETFEEKDIIGSTLVSYSEKEGIEQLNFNIYNDLSEVLASEDKEEVIKILKKHRLEKLINTKMDRKEMFYELLLKDKNYFMIKKLLKDPLTINSLKNKLNIDSIDSIINFVNVASLAEKNGEMLFKSKYHYFIRSLEGGYITVAPKQKFFLDRVNEVDVEGDILKAFEISICKYCNEVYIIGTLNRCGDLNILEQKEIYNFEDDGMKKMEYFLLKNHLEEINEDEVEDENIEDSKEYFLCGKCGSTFQKNSKEGNGKCNCDVKYLVSTIKLEKRSDELHTCISCSSSNTRGSVLKRFLIGSEGITSVLGTTLYETLPDKVIKFKNKEIKTTTKFFKNLSNKKEKVEEKIDKQFLVFSDSRQSAAYYSSFMNETYHKLMKKRIIVEALKSDKSYISIIELINRVTSIFQENNLYSKDDAKREAWKSVLYEVFDVDRRYSLEGLGLIHIKLDYEFPEALSTEQFSLSKDEVNDLLNVTVKNFRDKAAIKYDFFLTDDDKEYFSYKKNNQYFSLSNSNKDNGINSWLSQRRSNTRISFLERSLKFDKKEANEFLGELWDGVIREDLNLQNTSLKENIGYQLPIEELKITSGENIEWYYCSECNKLSPYNINNACPTFCCRGKLTKSNPDEILNNNHYREINKNMKIDNMKIAEHTAQLSPELAYDTQNKFINKDINILSCSTTFEMGVDVGELETIFLRNMPPSPANYAQRSGRAGRRGSSSAFTVTFCNKKSHDLTYYRNPENMILGVISPPRFDINNKKIAIRHIYAICYSYFWREHEESFGSIIQFFNEESISIFKKYLLDKPKYLKECLVNVFPNSLKKDLDIENWGWLEELLNEEKGLLYKVKNELYGEFEQIELVKRELQRESNDGKTGNGKFIDLLDRIKDTMEKKRIINYLSQKNLLPKYGFPVDSVELYTSAKIYDTTKNLRLNRDLSIAISEYAPGSQVIANGHLLTSRYIKKIPKMEWMRYSFKICPTCKTLNQEIYTGKEIERTCINCAEKLILKGVYIIPNFGFITDLKHEKAGIKKPKKTYNSDVHYLGKGESLNKIFVTLNNETLELESKKNDTLGVINSSTFYICENCGYGEVGYGGLFKKKPHKNYLGKDCNSSLKKYSIGHNFETDVVIVNQKQSLRKEECLSILYGMLEGISKYLNIDRNDVSGCLLHKNGRYSLIFYDAVPGGAGYVKHLLEKDNLKKVIQTTHRLIESCECGKDTSCYSCLRNYYNQKHHDILKREDVLEFTRRMLG